MLRKTTFNVYNMQNCGVLNNFLPNDEQKVDADLSKIH